MGHPSLFETPPSYLTNGRRSFDDTIEDALRLLTGIEIYDRMCNITNVFSNAKMEEEE